MADLLPRAPGIAVEDPLDEQARESDARLVRGVRWRLVLFSAASTLIILVALGGLLYLRAASSLQSAGIAQLDARAASLKQFLNGSDDPSHGTPTGLTFGEGTSGTFAILVTADGQPIGDLDDGVPAGLPNEDLGRRRPANRSRRARRDPGRGTDPDPERNG